MAASMPGPAELLEAFLDALCNTHAAMVEAHGAEAADSAVASLIVAQFDDADRAGILLTAVRRLSTASEEKK